MIFIETLIFVVFLFRKKLVLLADRRGLCFLKKHYFWVEFDQITET